MKPPFLDCQKTIIPFLPQHCQTPNKSTSPRASKRVNGPGATGFAERTRALCLGSLRVPVRAAGAAGGGVDRFWFRRDLWVAPQDHTSIFITIYIYTYIYIYINI